MPNETDNLDDITQTLDTLRIMNTKQKSLWQDLENYLVQKIKGVLLISFILLLLLISSIGYLIYILTHQYGAHSKTINDVQIDLRTRPLVNKDKLIVNKDKLTNNDKLIISNENKVVDYNSELKNTENSIVNNEDNSIDSTSKVVNHTKKINNNNGKIIQSDWSPIKGNIYVVSLIHNVKQNGQTGFLATINLKITLLRIARCRVISVILVESSQNKPKNLYNFWKENKFDYDSEKNNKLEVFIPYTNVYKGGLPYSFRFKYVVRLFTKIEGIDTQLAESFSYPFTLVNGYVE